jgi:hypothetical protein
MVMTEEKKLTELEKAQALVAQEKQERIKRFQQRLEDLLKEERCNLAVQVTLQGMTLVPHITVTAME